MKVITTKYLEPTDSYGPRFSASDDDGNKIILPYDFALHFGAMHDKVAKALCVKLGWIRYPLVRGERKKGNVYIVNDNHNSVGFTKKEIEQVEPGWGKYGLTNLRMAITRKYFKSFGRITESKPALEMTRDAATLLICQVILNQLKMELIANGIPEDEISDLESRLPTPEAIEALRELQRRFDSSKGDQSLGDSVMSEKSYSSA